MGNINSDFDEEEFFADDESGFSDGSYDSDGEINSNPDSSDQVIDDEIDDLQTYDIDLHPDDLEDIEFHPDSDGDISGYGTGNDLDAVLASVLNEPDDLIFFEPVSTDLSGTPSPSCESESDDNNQRRKRRKFS